MPPRRLHRCRRHEVDQRAVQGRFRSPSTPAPDCEDAGTEVYVVGERVAAPCFPRLRMASAIGPSRDGPESMPLSRILRRSSACIAAMYPFRTLMAQPATPPHERGPASRSGLSRERGPLTRNGPKARGCPCGPEARARGKTAQTSFHGKPYSRMSCLGAPLISVSDMLVTSTCEAAPSAPAGTAGACGAAHQPTVTISPESTSTASVATSSQPWKTSARPMKRTEG